MGVCDSVLGAGGYIAGLCLGAFESFGASRVSVPGFYRRLQKGFRVEGLGFRVVDGFLRVRVRTPDEAKKDSARNLGPSETQG